MTKTSTQNDLIRFLYDETSREESEQLQNALICEGDLLDEFNQLASTKAMLSGLLYYPSKESVDTILDYSKSTKLRSAR